MKKLRKKRCIKKVVRISKDYERKMEEGLKEFTPTPGAEAMMAELIDYIMDNHEKIMLKTFIKSMNRYHMPVWDFQIDLAETYEEIDDDMRFSDERSMCKFFVGYLKFKYDIDIGKITRREYDDGEKQEILNRARVKGILPRDISAQRFYNF